MKKLYLLIIVLSCWFGKNSLQAQCSVNISANPNTTRLNCSDTIITLKANATGSGKITYLWSTKETTASIKVKDSGNYSVKITAGGGCTSSSSIKITKDITIPEVNILAFPDAICSKDSSTLVGIGAESYKWIPGQLSGASIAVSPAATTKYIVTGTASNGCKGKDSFNLVVNPLPAAGISGGTSVCQYAAEPPITFKGSKGTAPYTFMYNIINGSTQGSTRAITTSGTNTSVTVTASTAYTDTLYYNLIAVTDANGCRQSQKGTVSVTVLPAPALVSAKTASICDSNKFIYTAKSSVTTTTFSWTRDTVTGISNPAVAKPGPGINETLYNTTDHPVTVNYIFTLSTGTGCITTDTLKLTVNPTPRINPIANYTFCNGESAMLEAFTSSSPNVAFTWLNNKPGIGLDANGSGNIPPFIATNNRSVANTATVTVKITSSSKNCPGPNTSFTIKVLPSSVLTSVKAASICNDSIFKYIARSSVANTTFSWRRPAVGNINDSMEAIGKDSIINDNLNNTTDKPIEVNYIFTLKTSAGCTTTDTLKLTVNPKPKIDSIHNYIFCNGSLAMLDSFKSSSPNAAFTWSNSNPAIGLHAKGSGNIAPFIAKNDSLETTITGTVTVKITASSDNCPGTPSKFTIQVLPAPALASAKATSVCDNSVFNYTATSSVDSTKFSWRRPVVEGISNPAGGDTTAVINETLHNTDTTPVVVNYVFTLSGNGDCGIATDTLKLTVNPTPRINPIANYTFCNGESAMLEAFTSSSPDADFTWYNTNPAIGLTDSGTGNIFPFIAINNSPDTIAIGTVTVKITASSNNCPGPNSQFTIKVRPALVLTSPKAMSICNDDSVKYAAKSSVANTTFSWKRDSVNGIRNHKDSVGGAVINESLHNITDTPVVVNYVFYLSTIGTDCVATDTLKLTVNPPPKINPISDYSFCDGDMDSIPINGNIQNASITWQLINNVSIGLPSNGTGNIPLFRATNTNDTTIVASLTANIKVGDSGECMGNPDSFNITVYPRAKLINSRNTSICDDSVFKDTAISSAANTIFSWTRPAVNGISNLKKDGAGAVIIDTLDNSTTRQKTVNYIFTLLTDRTKSCTYYDTLKVIVNPTPKLAHINDTVFCNKELVKAINFTGTPPDDLSFAWTNDNINIGLTDTGFGNITGFIATNTISDTAITGNIKVNITYGSQQCPGQPDSFTIKVNPSAAKPYFTSSVPYNDTLKLCNGSNNISFNINGPVTGTDYKWISSDTNTKIVHIKDTLHANTVISFLKLSPGDFYKITARATNTGACDDSISQVVKLLENDGIVERTIFKKQPGNLLIYPDNSLTTYQWGYDSVIINTPDTSFSPSVPIAGQVYQFFIPGAKFLNGEELNETDYLYWVALTNGTCYTKVYYNGPYVGDNLQAVPLPGGAPQLRVIPNPNNGVFEIVLSGNIYGNINAKIYNATGKAVYVKSFSKLTQSVNEKFVTGNLPSGFYFIELYSSDLKKVVSRFLIQR